MDEFVIGFDVRNLTDDDQWSQERENTFLIKTDIEKPLLVNTTVWQSALVENPPITRVGWKANTWSNLFELREHLRKQELQCAHWLIAITQFQ